jgi:hypothetical protein
LSPGKYHKHFLGISKESTETYASLSTRIETALKYYLKSQKVEMTDDNKQLYNLFCADRFKECVAQNLMSFVREQELGGWKTSTELSALLDRYIVDDEEKKVTSKFSHHNPMMMQKKQTLYCNRCDRAGHSSETCRTKLHANEKLNYNRDRDNVYKTPYSTTRYHDNSNNRRNFNDRDNHKSRVNRVSHHTEMKTVNSKPQRRNELRDEPSELSDNNKSDTDNTAVIKRITVCNDDESDALCVHDVNKLVLSDSVINKPSDVFDLCKMSDFNVKLVIDDKVQIPAYLDTGCEFSCVKEGAIPDEILQRYDTGRTTYLEAALDSVTSYARVYNVPACILIDKDVDKRVNPVHINVAVTSRLSDDKLLLTFKDYKALMSEARRVCD